jgi:two-component system response regulator NreC
MRGPTARVTVDTTSVTNDAEDQSSEAARGEIQVVLADDHAVVRSGLRLLLEREPDLRVVAEVGDTDEAKRVVAELKPTALVLDLNMPGPPTLSELPGMIASSPKTAIIVLTMQDEPAFAREALRAGARGYVAKQAAGAELVTAIRTTVAGATYLNPELGARLASAPPSPLDVLTRREIGVLQSLALGHTNVEVAEELGIGRRTVETHRAHIQQKLGLSSRAELTHYAREHDLID